MNFVSRFTVHATELQTTCTRHLHRLCEPSRELREIRAERSEGTHLFDRPDARAGGHSIRRG